MKADRPADDQMLEERIVQIEGEEREYFEAVLLEERLALDRLDPVRELLLLFAVLFVEFRLFGLGRCLGVFTLRLVLRETDRWNGSQREDEQGDQLAVWCSHFPIGSAVIAARIYNRRVTGRKSTAGFFCTLREHVKRRPRDGSVADLRFPGGRCLPFGGRV